MQNKKLLSLAILFCCLNLPDKKAFSQDLSAPTPTETKQTEDLLSLSFEDLMNMTFSSGSFLELDLKNSALSLTVINDDQINLSGARHLSELLEIYVPGFQYLNNKWNGIIWGMRGVGANRNTKFIFLVNGHKMNTEARDGAIMETELGLLGDIQRVEIIRGPAGLIYGSGAIAGVVNIVTEKYKTDEAKVSTNQGMWDGENFWHEYQGSVAASISPDANIIISGGYRKSDGIGMENGRLYGRPHWPYPQWMPNPPQDGVPTTGSAWSTPGNYRFSVDFNYKRFRYYSRYTNQVSNASGLFPVDPWPDYVGVDLDAPDRMVDGEPRSIDGWYGQIEPYNMNRRQYVMKNFTHQFSYKIPVNVNEVVLNAGIDLNTNRIQLENIKGYNQAGERTSEVPETFGERRYNASAMYLIKSVSKLQLAAGYQFRLFDIGDDMSGKNSQNEKALHPIVSDVTYTNHAFFTEGVYTLHKKLDAQVGLRYDLHTRTKHIGGVLTPKIALVAKPSNNHIIKAIYQTSANNGSADNYEFNRNTYGDDGKPFSGEDYHYENPYIKPGYNSTPIPPVTNEILHSLKPERSSSLEVASIHNLFKNRLTVATSASYNTISDMFTWNQQLFREINAGTYKFINLELDLKYSSSNLTIGANHAYSRLVNTNVQNEYSEYDLKIFDGSYDSTMVSGAWYYTPVPVKNAAGEDSTNTFKIYPIRDQISVDGKHFLNLNTNISKFYLDYKINEWLTLHTDLRVFWGLKGRQEVHEYDSTNTNPVLEDYSDVYANNHQFPYQEIHNKPMFKWNIGVRIKASERLTLSFYGYDLLAGKSNRNSLRWQQSSNIAEHTDLFAVDRTSFAFKLNYKFNL